MRRAGHSGFETTRKYYLKARDDRVPGARQASSRALSRNLACAPLFSPTRRLIKDTDRRALPLIGELVQLLADHQSGQMEGYSCVFVPPARYDYIQRESRGRGLWTYSDSQLKVVNNFGRDFGLILQRAGIQDGKFHDLRRTAICNWFEEGMSEFDVMKLAGHADFRTTHRFHLRVRDDLVQRARRATERGLCQKTAAKVLQLPSFTPIKKGKHS